VWILAANQSLLLKPDVADDITVHCKRNVAKEAHALCNVIYQQKSADHKQKLKGWHLSQGLSRSRSVLARPPPLAWAFVAVAQANVAVSEEPTLRPLVIGAATQL